MIESTTTYAGTYYYHFDASGNVVALTDDDGDTAQVYEYSVYGQVGATDPDHTNRFLFTGREFDKETGLYYYRARYYKPEIGRFLQVDPVGYEAGMNLYRYCDNNPWNLTDPYGMDPNSGNGSNIVSSIIPGPPSADPKPPDCSAEERAYLEALNADIQAQIAVQEAEEPLDLQKDVVRVCWFSGNWTTTMIGQANRSLA
jgi:RHS repeat-associated protein